MVTCECTDGWETRDLSRYTRPMMTGAHSHRRYPVVTLPVVAWQAPRWVLWLWALLQVLVQLLLLLLLLQILLLLLLLVPVMQVLTVFRLVLLKTLTTTRAC